MPQIQMLKLPVFHLNLISLLLLASAATGSPVSSGRDDAIEIVGRTEYRFYDFGVIQKETTNRFLLRLQGWRCSIEATENPLPHGLQVSKYQYVNDGTNSCFTVFFSKDSTNANPEASFPATSALVDIRPDVFPPMHTGSVGPVWLAYASGWVLKNSGEGSIPPLVFMGPGWPQFGRPLPSRWVLSRSFPRVPVFLAEFANAEAFDFADALVNEYKGTNFPSLYKSGYTNAIYQVLSWTNLGSMRIPQHSRFSKYVPILGASSTNSLGLEATYDVYSERTKSRATPPARMPSVVPKNATVRDYRAAQSDFDPVPYVSVSGQIKE